MTVTTSDTPLTAAVSQLRDGGEQAVLAAVARIAPELAARAAENDRLGVFPRESIDLIWSTGLGSLTIPRERGGIGVGLTTTARAIEALAREDAGATLVFVWSLLFYRLINGEGSPWPRELTGLVNDSVLQGPALANFLNVEPQLGTSARGGLVETSATRVTLADGSPGWRINGHKIYSTGSSGLRWLVVTAHTPEDDPEGLRVGTFLIPGGTAGIEVVGTWDHLGMRATASNDVIFTDVDIPFEHGIGLGPYTGGTPELLGADPSGTLASTILLVLVIYNGIAKASRDALVRFLNDRRPSNLGSSLAALPRFQEAVGEIEALIYANDRLIFDFTQRFDRRQAEPDSAPPPSRSEVSIIKVLVSRNVITTTERALALTGNPGLTRNHVLERHYRDALCSRVHTPQEDLVLIAAGKAAFGLDAR
jgi:alkylation response protein AidB-like acyl-CoA dehydrogenase